MVKAARSPESRSAGRYYIHRVIRRALPIVASLVVAACSGGAGDVTGPPVTPADTAAPTLLREMRGVWVATVANIDWPSARTLSVAQQQAELIDILDRAKNAGLNAVILQVRPAGDALYASEFEPWSIVLTGTQGQDPGWNPLAFAISEAHSRGLELHAWVNPF